MSRRRASSESCTGQGRRWTHSERLAHPHPLPALSREGIKQGERRKGEAGRSERAAAKEVCTHKKYFYMNLFCHQFFFSLSFHFQTSEHLHYDYVIHEPRVFLKTQPCSILNKTTSTMRSGYGYARKLQSRVGPHKSIPGPNTFTTTSGDIGYDIAWDFSRLQPLMTKLLQSELHSI